MKKILSILCGMFIFISSAFLINVYAKTEIPIAMSLDNNYTLPTIVAMTSMLENVNSDTFYKFHLLLSGDFREENKNKILSLKDKYSSKQFEINFIDMKNEFKNSRTRTTYNGKYRHTISICAFYRLCLPSILKNYDKVIYLDGDTIIQKDLCELYNLNLEDYYIAGVKEASVHDKYAKTLGINDVSQYINSGVLLMNLKKMRDDNLKQQFQYFIENKTNKGLTRCLDQDIINSCCYGKIKIIPLKYNAMAPHLNDITLHPQSKNALFYGKNFDAALNDPTIIHYTGPKPWVCYDTFFGEKWWYYANKSGLLNNDNFINTLPIKNRIKLRNIIQAAKSE